MRLTLFALIMTVTISLSYSNASAQEAPLSLEQVLDSSLSHFPQIKAALSNIEAARGAVQSAKGPFDLTLNNTTYSRFNGFFSGDFTDTEITKRFQDYNAEVSVGYRIANGDFPVYQDYFFTNEGGEASIRVAFSLLRDKNIDRDRFNILKEEIGLNQSVLDTLLTKVSVQQQAFRAYLNWITSGQRYETYQDLLKIAETRQSALKQRAERGDIPKIQLVENKQIILQRESILRQAQRDFDNARNILSLFLRDDQGTQIAPTKSQLPDRFPKLKTQNPNNIDEQISRILGVSPEFGQIENQMALAKGEIELGQNSTKPRLDLEFYNAEDFGFGDNGSPTREGFESTVTVNLSFNLQQNLGKGQINKGKAALKNLEFRKQQLTEQIRISLLNIINNIDAAQEIVALSQEEISLAGQMEAAEKTRFENGQSNFFLINAREITSADARIKNINAQQTHIEALGNYLVATLDFESLGIDLLQ